MYEIKILLGLKQIRISGSISGLEYRQTKKWRKLIKKSPKRTQTLTLTPNPNLNSNPNSLTLTQP